MDLKDRLDEDLMKAVRGQDVLRRSVLRLLKSEVHNEEIAQRKPLDEAGIAGIIVTQVRRHRESISEFRRGNRDDLVLKEEAELEVLLGYLPPQLTPEEITSLAEGIIQDVGAKGPGDKGKVMGRLMPQVKGKAEGTTVNEVVARLLDNL